eukprot:353041-Chlamydomonas_euryale.AAC.2
MGKHTEVEINKQVITLTAVRMASMRSSSCVSAASACSVRVGCRRRPLQRLRCPRSKAAVNSNGGVMAWSKNLKSGTNVRATDAAAGSRRGAL